MGAGNGIDYEAALKALEKWYEKAQYYKNNIDRLTEYAGSIKRLRNRLGASSSETDREYQIFKRAVLVDEEVQRLLAMKRRDKPHILVTSPPRSVRIGEEGREGSEGSEGAVSPQGSIAAAHKEADFIEENFKLYGSTLSKFVLEQFADVLATHLKRIGALPSVLSGDSDTYARLLRLRERVRMALELANKPTTQAAPTRSSAPVVKLGIVIREEDTERLLPKQYDSDDEAKAAGRNMLKRLVPTLRSEENDPHIDVGYAGGVASLVSAKTGKVYMTARVVTYAAYAKDHPTNVIKEVG
jgi:hypothetical protein